MPTTRSQSIAQANKAVSHYTHHDTPTKAAVLAACKALDDRGIKGYKESIFREYGVGKTQGWEILRQGRARRHLGPDTDQNETRGRPPLISLIKLRKLERIVEDFDVESRLMSWETLAYESGLDVSKDTIRRAIGTLNYHKCLACKKGWVNKATAERRREYAEVMYERYPHKKD
ncbi:hypothetical protein BDV95DRAFT_82469 [Massariosphaeria phaeospora]|uniref:Transposase Tc1-like domain-containing protein n=1 Tax=Massariosphaeria phaeospora TaxID=100035 RepID=A0A7C8M5W5_9PLEO|nr:hypothetical protein BDV95DRAFT_82469 [Massariosphaeria phaeospora]